MRGLILSAALGMGALGGVAPPQEFAPRVHGAGDPARLSPQHAVPSFADVQDQFDYAKQLKSKRHAAQGSEREQWGLRAVDAYRAVRARFPRRKRWCQEALFRAGQLLGAMGREEEALADFFRVSQGRGPFAIRALLESAHLLRRMQRMKEARGYYQRVSQHADSSEKARAEALLFLGDCWLQLGQTGAAMEAWRVLIKGSDDGRKRVLAFDRLGRIEIEFGSTLRPATLFLECLENLGEVVLEQSEEGRRVRRALERSALVRHLVGLKKVAR